MKRKRTGTFTPRIIDRVVFAAIAQVHVLGGAYLLSPWFLGTTTENTSPIAEMLRSDLSVKGFGIIILFNGLALFYAAIGRGRHYTFVTINALLWGFLLRLYALLASLLTLESWRPPTYLSQIAIVAILAGYWVWVKVNARPTG